MKKGGEIFSRERNVGGVGKESGTKTLRGFDKWKRRRGSDKERAFGGYNENFQRVFLSGSGALG